MLRETDERFVPWTQEAGHAYLHLHHYALARDFARDKHVLDLGSGEGYGSALLAKVASKVVGVELEPEAVHHASSTYQTGSLRFVCGDVRHLPEEVGDNFDLATCFEVFEHVEEQETLLKEAKSRLKPQGIMLLSTPNRLQSEETNQENPYHPRELHFDEFWQILKRNFKNVTFLGQNLFSGSAIWDLEKTGAVCETYVSHASGRFELVPTLNRRPNFFLAAATDGDPVAQGVRSLLTDTEDARVHQYEQTSKEHIKGFGDALRVVKGMQDVQSDRDQQLEATKLSLVSSESALEHAQLENAQLKQRLATQERTLNRIRRTIFFRAYKLLKRLLRPKT